MCIGSTRPLCKILDDLQLTNRGWIGSSRTFNEIALLNKNILRLDETSSASHSFTTFSFLRRKARAFICRKCYQVDAEVVGRNELNIEDYKPNHRCVGMERKRHMCESVILESESFFSMDSIDQSSTQSNGHREICEKSIQFDSIDSAIRMRIECLAENMTKSEAIAHKNICPVRTGNQTFSKDNVGNFVKLLWSIAKQSGADKALIDCINKDLMDNSHAENGISLLRNDVTIPNCDVYALDGYANYHVIHRLPSHKNRRRQKLEVSLSTLDIKLLSGAGSTMRNLKHIVSQLHRSNVSTSKNTIIDIQNERRLMRERVEIVTINNVARRHNQSNRGSSHLVRFKNAKLMEYMRYYIYDSNGELRNFVKDTHSLSLSSDHGKGSLKLILSFNSPGYKISSNESILLGIAKCTEDEVSLKLLIESCWPMLIFEYSQVLKKPVYLTGDQKNLALIFGTGSGSSEYCCVFCHTPRVTKIDKSANPGDKTKKLASDRTKHLANFDEFYGRIGQSKKRKLDDWTCESTNSINKDSIQKLQPMNPLIKSFMENANLEYIDQFAVVGGLHFKLAWNKYFEYATSPVKWIHNFHLKSSTGQLNEKEKQFIYNCTLIEQMVTQIRPKRHGPTGQLDCLYTGGDITTITDRAETLVHLLEQQQKDESIDLKHAIDFFSLSNKLHILCQAILGKELDSDWRAKLHDFRCFAIDFLKNCRHIGLYYLHCLIHVEDIIERTGVSLGLIGNDQVNFTFRL